MKKFIKGILVSLLPVVFATIGIIFLSTSDTPTVKFQPEKVRPGYETEQAKYIVEASYSKYWHDSRIPLLIVIAYIIMIAGTAIVINIIEAKYMGANAGNIIMAGVWILGFVLIFIPMVPKYGSSSYQSTLTVQEYEANKNNLDNLFPSIESISK
jgi:hypothetical protein